MTTTAGPEVPTLVLWTRRQCHLCDIAKEELHALQRRLAFRIEERDVDERADWAERYGDQVPVGTVAGQKVFKYRVEPRRLATALRRRGAHGTGAAADDAPGTDAAADDAPEAGAAADDAPEDDAAGGDAAADDAPGAGASSAGKRSSTGC